MKNNIQQATLFIISAPSGAGKTSLVKALLNSTPNIAVSISHTTRQPRPGEGDGKDYHFVEVTQFEQMRDRGEFLEHARVFDNFYGTSATSVNKQLNEGIDTILEIDWQGAEQVRKLYSQSVGIFIIPPSRAALEERLKSRGQDDSTVIARRMKDAISEMSHYAAFDYLVVNDEFDHALENLRAIVLAQRQSITRQSLAQEQLLQQLLS